MTLPRFLVVAQLLRLPNVFTAFSDILMAGLITGLLIQSPGTLVLLLLASACFYLGGMVWNDIFDRDEDARTRPFRPLPSGRVSLRFAVILGTLLMLAGPLFTYLATLTTTLTPRFPWWLMAGSLFLAIMLYDGIVKSSWIGPMMMGTCRFLNVLLGLSFASDEEFPLPLLLHISGVVGVYILGVTVLARTEEIQSDRRLLLVGSGVILVSLLMALLIPAHLEPGQSSVFYPYFLVGFAFWLGFPIEAAVRLRTPKAVQAAVKTCILGLVFLDAIIASGFIGLPGLLLMLLLVPAIALGKRVYST